MPVIAGFETFSPFRYQAGSLLQRGIIQSGLILGVIAYAAYIGGKFAQTPPAQGNVFGPRMKCKSPDSARAAGIVERRERAHGWHFPEKYTP